MKLAEQFIETQNRYTFLENYLQKSKQNANALQKMKKLRNSRTPLGLSAKPSSSISSSRKKKSEGQIRDPVAMDLTNLKQELNSTTQLQTLDYHSNFQSTEIIEKQQLKNRLNR